MKIRASNPDETTYLAIFFAGLNFFNSMKNYANEFNFDFFYTISASLLLGAVFGIFFMRVYGWILPEKEDNE